MIHAVHDPDGNRIAEYDYDSATGTSTLIRQYVWMDGRPVAVVEGGQVYFNRTDHIGRPVFATNDLGVKVWEASYLPVGGVHVATGGIDLRFPPLMHLADALPGHPASGSRRSRACTRTGCATGGETVHRWGR